MEPEKDSASPPRTPLWPLALLGTLGFALMRSLFKTPGKQSEPSISPRAKPSNKDNQNPDFLPLIPAQLPPAPTNAENACKCCHHKMPRWKVALEVGTFVAALGAFISAAVYAGITYSMWKEMQHTNKLTSDALQLNRKMFNATQVAGFICQINQSVTTLEGADAMQVQISCNNRGKSSASDVMGMVKFDRAEFGKILQHEERPISEKVILEGDGFSRLFAVTRSYSWKWIEKQDMTIRIEIHYGNGLDTASQSYCWRLHTRTKERSFTFVDCANYADAKKLLP